MGSPVDVVVTAKSQEALYKFRKRTGNSQWRTAGNRRNLLKTLQQQQHYKPGCVLKLHYTSDTRSSYSCFQLKRSMESGSEIDVEVKIYS
jgi:hypothetical protein